MNMEKYQEKLDEGLKAKPIIPYAKAKLKLLKSIIRLKKKKIF